MPPANESGTGILKLFSAFVTLAEAMPLVLPLHPRNRARLEALGALESLGSIMVLPPVGYLDRVWLEQQATCILTDSGGESNKRPVSTMCLV